MKKKPVNPIRFGAAEQKYTTSLRQVAKHVGDIVRGFDPELANLPPMLATLRRYADMLHPWATNTAFRMLTEVNNRDLAAWKSRGDVISKALHKEIQAAPTGFVMRGLLDAQVGLITSLPLQAGRRAQELAARAVESGSRYAQFVEEIARTGEVTLARATMIARTETSRAASTLTRARAEAIGSTAYVWQTSRDGAVRPSHKEMQGRVVQFADPPTLDNLTGHAGCLPNCRCWQQIIIPD